MQQMLEGEQPLGCLDYVRKLDEKYPGRACLQSIRLSLENAVGDHAAAETTLGKFLRSIRAMRWRWPKRQCPLPVTKIRSKASAGCNRRSKPAARKCRCEFTTPSAFWPWCSCLRGTSLRRERICNCSWASRKPRTNAPCRRYCSWKALDSSHSIERNAAAGRGAGKCSLGPCLQKGTRFRAARTLEKSRRRLDRTQDHRRRFACLMAQSGDHSKLPGQLSQRQWKRCKSLLRSACRPTMQSRRKPWRNCSPKTARCRSTNFRSRTSSTMPKRFRRNSNTLSQAIIELRIASPADRPARRALPPPAAPPRWPRPRRRSAA